MELVPGDLVELHVGDKVPADIRLMSLKTATLRLEQASLTGEAMPVHKELAAVANQDCELQAKDNMLFAGTAVVNGHCFGIVNNIGMTTEIGKIQQQIHEASSEDEDTPLKKKLDHFGEVLAQVCQIFLLSAAAQTVKSANQHFGSILAPCPAKLHLAVQILNSQQPLRYWQPPV